MSDRPSDAARAVIATICLTARENRRPVCLDSGPLIDYIALHEPVATLLAPLVEDADVPLVISTISLAEVVGRPAMAGDHQRVETIHRSLRDLQNLMITSLDARHAIEAAVVRGLTGLRLPDAAVVATARLAGACALIGNDRQWNRKVLGVPYFHIDEILNLS